MRAKSISVILVAVLLSGLFALSCAFAIQTGGLSLLPYAIIGLVLSWAITAKWLLNEGSKK